MIKELDTVILSHDVEGYALKKQDMGTVVHCYDDNMAYEVEFVTGRGETVALLTLTQKDIRPVGQRDMFRVREFAVPLQTTEVHA